MTRLYFAVLFLLVCILTAGCGTSPEKAIYQAARKGKTEKVKSLLSKDPHLITTVFKEEYTIVNGIVTSKYEDRDGDTVLHCALKYNHQDTAELLIAQGADISAKNCCGDTPLHKASEQGLAGSAELLISKGADINAINIRNQTPLFYAVDKGHRDIVGLLVSKGAEVNIEDRDGETPLNRAVEKDFVDIAECLLNKGATLNKSGTTLLHLAAHSGALKTAAYLLSSGAPVDGRDKNNDTPLLCAQGAVSALLIEKGADVNAKGQNNDTPLLRAAQQHAARETWFLISKGARVNASNTTGDTPLHYSSNGCLSIVKQLIDAKADVTKQNIYGLTPLHKSSTLGYQDIAELLLSNGVDINARDNMGRTPLDYALETADDTHRPEEIRERCRKYAEYLRKKGATQ